MVERKRFSPRTSVATGPEQRRLRLIGAIGAAKTLNGCIGAPARFQQIMDALSLIFASTVGMIAASRAAGVREHKDALVVIHEGLRLGEIGHGGAVFDLEDGLAMRIRFAHKAAAASGHFGDLIRSKMLHDLIEGARHSREACQLLDQRIAAGNGFLGMNGLAVNDNRPGTKIAFLIRVALIKLRRKTMTQVIKYILFRSDINGKITPFLGRDF